MGDTGHYPVLPITYEEHTLGTHWHVDMIIIWGKEMIECVAFVGIVTVLDTNTNSRPL